MSETSRKHTNPEPHKDSDDQLELIDAQGRINPEAATGDDTSNPDTDEQLALVDSQGNLNPDAIASTPASSETAKLQEIKNKAGTIEAALAIDGIPMEEVVKDPELFNEVLKSALGEKVFATLGDNTKERLRTEKDLNKIIEDMRTKGHGNIINDDEAFVKRFTDIFAKAEVAAQAKALEAGVAGGESRPLTPEQRERATKLHAAANRLAELKAKPFYKRNKAEIDAAKAEYDALAQEVGHELVAEAPDEPSRQAQFAAVQVGMWKDINARVADLRKDTKYGKIVEKIGKMHPAARIALMTGLGVGTGLAAGFAGALIGGGATVAVGVGAAVTMTKVARAKVSVDASMSEANQLRAKGQFDALIAKFGQVTGLARLGARSERKLKEKYEGRAAERIAALEEQAASEGWDDDTLVAKKARAMAGMDTHMEAARARKAFGISMGALAVGTAAGFAAHEIYSAHHSGGNQPTEKPTEKPINKPAALTPEQISFNSHKAEMDFLNTNGRVHNDFNNITPDEYTNVEGDKGHFAGYTALHDQYTKSPTELAAQMQQIQSIDRNFVLNDFPRNPGETDSGYFARLNDAMYGNQELHDKMTDATLDYIQKHGQPLHDLTQDYGSNYLVMENGKLVAKWDSYVSSTDPNDKVLMLTATKGIRFPCGQPIELIPVQHTTFAPHAAPASYDATRPVSNPAPVHRGAPAPRPAPAPIPETPTPTEPAPEPQPNPEPNPNPEPYVKGPGTANGFVEQGDSGISKTPDNVVTEILNSLRPNTGNADKKAITDSFAEVASADRSSGVSSQNTAPNLNTSGATSAGDAGNTADGSLSSRP